MLSAISFKNHAQVSITKADLPTATTFAEYYSDGSGNLTLPTSGLGQTWNYGTLQPSDTSITSFKAASSSPYYSKFPDASTVQESTDSEESQIFYKEGLNGLYVVGAYNPSVDSTLTFERPALLYPAPISYNQKVIDSSRIVFSGEVESVNVIFSMFAREQYESIGAGTITTPAGTFNTLLIKSTRYSYDTIKYDIPLFPLPPQVTLDTTISYVWVQKDKSLPVVFELGEDEFEENEVITKRVTASYYSKEIPTALKAAINADFSKHYPMPADKFLTIELKKNQVGTFTLCSMDGVVKKSFLLPNTNKIQVETSDLEAGVYLYEIKTVEGVVKNKIVITH